MDDTITAPKGGAKIQMTNPKLKTHLFEYGRRARTGTSPLYHPLCIVRTGSVRDTLQQRY